MSVSDAVSVFAEGTFEEQILELVNYLAQKLPEEERPTYVQHFRDVLTTQEGQKPIDQDEDLRRDVLTLVLGEVKGFGEGADREIEGFFNLLFAHFLSLFPLNSSDSRQHLSTLLATISSSDEPSTLKYRILSNFFNTIPRRSGLRLIVHQALVQLASANDELDQLQLSTVEVDKWISEWDITSEEKSTYLKTLVDVFGKAGKIDKSYQFEISYVKSLPPSSAGPAAIDLVATALRLPTIFDFDGLFRINAVVAAKSHELFSLLQIFLNDGLAQYNAWESKHGDLLTKYNLDKAQLGRKIRLLTLATLGFQNISRDVPYSTLASALQVDVSEVERWVIDGIRAGLITGKLSQTTKTLHILRATARSFEREQWEVLEKRLVAWKTGLAGILEVVQAAKKKTTPVETTAAVVETPQQPQEAVA